MQLLVQGSIEGGLDLAFRLIVKSSAPYRDWTLRNFNIRIARN